MSPSTVISDPRVERVLSGGRAARIAALHSIDAEPLRRSEWSRMRPYLGTVLDPGASVDDTERVAAIRVAGVASTPAIRRALHGLRDPGHPIAIRVAAAEALARAGDPSAASGIVTLLDARLAVGVRVQLAEHLLLVDATGVRTDVARLIDTDRSPRVRAVLANAIPASTTAEALPEPPPARRATAKRAAAKRAPARKAAAKRTTAKRAPAKKAAAPPRAGSGPERVATRGDDAVPGVVTPVRRFFEGRADSHVVVGEILPVTVRVARERSEGWTAVEFDIEIPPEGVELRVVVDAPGFETPSSSRRLLRVEPDKDASMLIELRALAPGQRQVLVTLFSPSGTQLAELVLPVAVGRKRAAVKPVEARVSVQDIAADDGEVSLLIDWLEDKGQYRFQLISASLPPEVLTDRLMQKPQEIVDGLITDLDALATAEEKPTDVRAWLADRGADLWERLVPNEIKDEFWDLQGRIRSLRIASRDDLVPWELLYPLARGHDDGFLVEQFPVMRCVRGLATPDTVGGDSVVTVEPVPGAPASAAAECSAVEAHWTPSKRRARINALPALRSEVEGGDFGVMHFACHNKFDFKDAARSRIKFGGDSFTPVTLARSVTLHSLVERHPLVFINACTSAGQAPSYAETSGFAARFIEAGAGAFVGSMWKVRDGSAARFAEAFYDTFVGGGMLGEAMTAGRDAIKSQAGDPTWLAYTAYGSANATMAVTKKRKPKTP